MKQYLNIVFSSSEWIKKENEIINLYKKAFSGFPWFESENEAINEIKNVLNKPRLQSLIAYNMQQKIVGILMYDFLNNNQLAKERGEVLSKFTDNLLKEQNVSIIVWEREIFTDPLLFNNGIATELRKKFIKHFETEYPNGTIILSRMWDKNPAIIHIGKKLGYRRTGIKISSLSFEAEYEYWYKIIKKVH